MNNVCKATQIYVRHFSEQQGGCELENELVHFFSTQQIVIRYQFS